MRAENAQKCNPDQWEMDFDLWESSAELPQKTRNIHLKFSAKIRKFWVFEAKTWIFPRQKTTCGTDLRRIAAKRNIYQTLPKIFDFMPLQKKWRQKWPSGVFWTDGKRGACAIPKGDRWNVAMVWEGEPLGRRCHCYCNNAVDQERCKIYWGGGGWLKLLARRMRNSVILEAQQRYFSYRAILVAIVSQNYFVLVFMGYRTIMARYVAKRGIAQMCLCKTKFQGGGGIAPFWGSPNLPEKLSRDMGYRSDSIAVSRDMGPLIKAVIQSKIQEPCKTEPAKHVSCWAMTTENMSLAPDLMRICLGAFWGHEARKGGIVCILS